VVAEFAEADASTKARSRCQGPACPHGNPRLIAWRTSDDASVRTSTDAQPHQIKLAYLVQNVSHQFTFFPNTSAAGSAASRIAHEDLWVMAL